MPEELCWKWLGEMPWFPVRVRDLYSVVVRSHGGDVTPNNVDFVVPLLFLSKRFCFCNLKYRKSQHIRHAVYAILYIFITGKFMTDSQTRLNSSDLKGIYGNNKEAVINCPA